jgi:ferrous-iron efflux pump FieF
MTEPATPPLNHQRLSSAEAGRLMRLATYASTGVALVLIAIKLYAWAQSDSIRLLATLVDSCLDALASLINLAAVRHALTPADHEHRFGHGKAEALAGLGQAAFITGSAGFLLVEAAQRLINPTAIGATALGQLVMVVSMALTLMLVIFQRHVIAKTGSTAISADALHYKSDLLVNAAVIVALFFAARGWGIVDPLLALAVGFYILYSAGLR